MTERIEELRPRGLRTDDSSRVSRGQRKRPMAAKGDNEVLAAD